VEHAGLKPVNSEQDRIGHDLKRGTVVSSKLGCAEALVQRIFEI